MKSQDHQETYFTSTNHSHEVLALRTFQVVFECLEVKVKTSTILSFLDIENNHFVIYLLYFVIILS